MSDELIERYVDRAKFGSDSDFIKSELKEIEALYTKISGIRISISASKGIKESTAATEEGIKANARLQESVKAVDKVVKDRFATEAKLVTLQTDYARETAKNRVEIQKTNQELKLKAQYQLAESGSIEKARAAVLLLNIERNKLNLFTEDGQKRQAKLNEQIDKYNGFIKKNVDALSQQKINVGNYQGSAKIIVDALDAQIKKTEELEKAKIRVQNAGGSFTPSSSAGRTVITGFGGPSASSNPVLENVAKNAKSSADAIKILDEEIAKSKTVIEGFSRVTENPKFLNVAAKVGDAQAELKLFTRTLIELQQKGFKDSDPAIQQLKKRLAELTDEVGDTKAEIKALSSDTRSFDLFAGSITFAADAFQTFAGAAVLAGASEEDAAAATKTLVAVQSVANGVKGIANELTTKGTAANKLFAFAQGQVTTAMDVSATAAARLKAVLVTVGIGALIIGIGLLIANFQKIQDTLTGTNDATRALTDTIEDYKKGAADAAEKTIKVKNAFDQAREGVISKKEALRVYNGTLGDAFGKTNDLALAEKMFNDKKDDYIEAMGLKAQANALFAKSAEAISKGLTAAEEDQTSWFDKVVASYSGIGAGSSYLVAKQIENSDKVKKDAESLSDALFKEGSEKMKAALKKSNDDKTLISDEAIKIKQEELQKSLELEKRNAAASKAIAIERANESIRLSQLVLDNENSSLPDQLKALENISSQKKKLAAIDYADSVKNEKSLKDGLIEINSKTGREIEAARKVHNDKLKAIDDESMKQKRDIELREIDKQAAIIISKAEEQNNGLNTALNKQFSQGLIDQQAYDDGKLDLENKYQQISLQNQIDHQKKILEVSGLSDSKKAEALKELSALEVEQANLELKIKSDLEERKARILDTATQAERDRLEKEKNESIEALNKRFELGKISQQEYDKERLKIELGFQAESLQTEIDYQKKLLEISDLPIEQKKAALKELSNLERELSDLSLQTTKANEQKKLDAILATLDKVRNTANDVFGVIDGLLNANLTSQKNALEEQNKKNEQKAARDIEIVNASGDSEERKAARVALINDRLAKQKQQIADREKNAELQKARFDKAKAIFDIVVSTASAVVKALPNIPLSIAVGALGLAQLGIALGTPLPKFFRGKDKNNKYEGWATVNDNPDRKTSEIIVREDGSLEMPMGRDVLTFLGRNDQVIPDANEFMRNRALKDVANVRTGHSNNDVGYGQIMIQRLDRQNILLDRIANKKELHLTGNSSSLEAMWRHGANSIKWIDEQTQYF